MFFSYRQANHLKSRKSLIELVPKAGLEPARSYVPRNVKSRNPQNHLCRTARAGLPGPCLHSRLGIRKFSQETFVKVSARDSGSGCKKLLSTCLENSQKDRRDQNNQGSQQALMSEDRWGIRLWGIFGHYLMSSYPK